MKSLYSKVFLLILLSFKAYSQNIPSYVPTNGLVGWWPFNGNANDESGNGNNLSKSGNVTYESDRNNKSLSCVKTYGATNDYLYKNNVNLPVGNSNRTVSVWYKIINQTNGPNIFTQWEVGHSCYSSFGILGSLDNVYFWGRCTDKMQGYSASDNNWINITIVYENNYFKIFKNGIQLNTNNNAYFNYTASLNTSSNQLLIGGRPNNPDQSFPSSFNGLIDDIGVWNRALTQQEITDLFNSQTCANPIATITPQGNTTFCQGGSVNLNASTGTNYTYEWYKNGQLINGATASIYQATTSGNYTVKVIDGVCNATSSATTVTVNAIPSNGVTVNGNTTFCQGGSTTLTAQGTGSYLWSNGATTQSINATQTGNYSLVVTQNGCSATSSQTAITVNPLPTATITPQGNTTFCQGGFVTLVASGGSTYQWNSGAQTASISANQAGTFTVNVFNQFNCQASASQVVTVNANPTVTLNALNNVVYKTSSPIQLVGNPNGGTYSGEAVSGSIFTPANATLGRKTISYNYTSQQGCSGSASQTTIVADTVGNVCSTYDTLRIKVKFTAGLYANTTNTVKFYPNPTNDILFIDNGNYQAMSGYTIKIVSLTGAIIYNQPITSQQVQISMNQFATKGLYYAQIFDPNNQLVDAKKIVLE